MSKSEANTLRKQILDADDRPMEAVDVPEWGEGVVVYVRPMTINQVRNLQDFALLNEEDLDPGKVVARAALDAEGRRLFRDGDAHKLNEKAIEPLMRVMSAFLRLNGLDAEVQGRAEKNSETTRGDDSSSSSPASSAEPDAS